MTEINLKDAYRREFKIRQSGGTSSSFEVTLPREVVRKHAEDFGLSLKEATEKLQAQVFYDGFDGVFIKFAKKELEKEEAEE